MNPQPIPAEAEGHSPLPWQVGAKVKTMVFSAQHPNRSAICEALLNDWDNQDPWINRDRQRANAALIAHCVSNYGPAMEGIRAIQEAANDYMDAVDAFADSLGRVADDSISYDERCESAMKTSIRVGKCKTKLRSLLAQKEGV